MGYHTSETLPTNVKDASAQELQKLVYCGIDLNMQIKESHWTMAGREFLSIHRLFDEVSEAIEDTVDDYAERVSQLGHKPNGVLQVVADKSPLTPYPKEIKDIDEHVEVIAHRLAFFSDLAYQAINKMDEHGDVISVDLVTSRTRDIDKLIWLVESHLPKKR
ncbi:DNA starvation/stationary phase protection protein Dps [Parendozoicomonas haliclonae]|uniref:DNA protection during starvation protein n=2 Tax=Parendozoicomonas haliclonae TaxID=1960125 RepID=A0A1X7AL93_9GAMM|nr:DNA protection during starvation protein [Parendozoicomonas haliclonae]